MIRILLFSTLFAILTVSISSYPVYSAETNTVSSTVVTDKAPPTANAPSIVVNNSDICKTGAAASIQTQILGVASGITITDKNCERLKLARSLYAMGMKVAAVSALCQDPRVFDSMWMAGSPCPFMGSIGNEAKAFWIKNTEFMPNDSEIRLREELKLVSLQAALAVEASRAKLVKINEEKEAKKKATEAIKEAREKEREKDGTKKRVWASPLGIIALILLL